jgi:hypothetical protein
MAINRASLSDTLPHAPAHRDGRGELLRGNHQDSTPRIVMVIGGFFLALVSLVIGSIGIAEVWFTATPSAGSTVAAEAAQGRPWETVAMIGLGGLGFAAGAALVGIGMGRWTAPRPATSDADYTGPGHIDDQPQPPRVV